MRPAAVARRDECGAVYVELAEHPSLDRVLECTRPHCTEHPKQLNWVRQDPRRVAAYADLEARLGLEVDAGEQAELL